METAEDVLQCRRVLVALEQSIEMREAALAGLRRRRDQLRRDIERAGNAVRGAAMAERPSLTRYHAKKR